MSDKDTGFSRRSFLRKGAATGAIAAGGLAATDTALATGPCPYRVKRTHDCESKNENALKQGGRLVTFHQANCTAEARRHSIWTIKDERNVSNPWCNDHQGRIRCYEARSCDGRYAEICVRGSFPIGSQWQVVEVDECLPRGNGGGGGP